MWDKDHISTVDVKGNMLRRCSSKRSGIPETRQLVLKVVMCFGVINKLVFEKLSKTVISN